MNKLKTTNINRDAIHFVKPSELIDIHEVSPLTLTDRRVFNQLIANAWENIEADKEHVISKSALMGSMTGNDRIEKNILRLMGAIVQVKTQKDGESATQRVHLLGTNIEHDRKDGLLYYRFPDELRALIANSTVWAKIQHDVMFAFTSKYALTLYEMIQKRRNLRITHEKFSITEIRSFLGVPKNKLKRFADLNKYALKKAVEEVNGLSDMEVRIIPLKRGRTVVSVEIWWYQKDLPKAKESYAELQRHKVGRKARLSGILETPVLDNALNKS